VVVEARLGQSGVAALGETHAAWGGRARVSLRWVLVHMVEEYARHNGHADLIRESIDGQTGVRVGVVTSIHNSRVMNTLFGSSA